MDRTGLIGKIQIGVTTIYQGRQWLDTEGLEGEGRISYKRERRVYRKLCAIRLRINSEKS